jgi:hypothetical protein
VAKEEMKRKGAPQDQDHLLEEGIQHLGIIDKRGLHQEGIDLGRLLDKDIDPGLKVEKETFIEEIGDRDRDQGVRKVMIETIKTDTEAENTESEKLIKKF